MQGVGVKWNGGEHRWGEEEDKRKEERRLRLESGLPPQIP